MSRECRSLDVSALTTEEWNYIRGLFLADGYSSIHGTRFCFSKDEEGLAYRLIELLKRAQLAPKISKSMGKKMVNVDIYSRSLHSFLPSDKRSLANTATWSEFLKKNRLRNVMFGVPFVAGLIDGDGCCSVHIQHGNASYFGTVSKWRWVFSQSKYPYLTEYLKRFVENLASRSIRVCQHDRVSNDLGSFNGVTDLNILKPGALALLNADISKYSWKVSRWLEKVQEAYRERRTYSTTGRIARIIGVHPKTIRRWLGESSGNRQIMTRYVRRKSTKDRKYGSWYYIPESEVEKLNERVLTNRLKAEKLKRAGWKKLVDVAKMLGIHRTTLNQLYWRGELQARLLYEKGLRKCLLIPKSDVERLAEQYGRMKRVPLRP
jgi:hypothetical protein